ncbi:MAG TPA: 50S ribosomal protein L28 [Spirochaetota bacterium]|nr:50S ribosomal protein L28 [Spirochaetota bacterium]HPS85651.1 50S ribosomal protein L28 [Spirochaetota bacterium]
MAKCEICGKSVQFGCNVSHSHLRTNKMWKANVKKIRVLVNNRTVRKNVCTRCIRTGNVVKAV